MREAETSSFSTTQRVQNSIFVDTTVWIRNHRTSKKKKFVNIAGKKFESEFLNGLFIVSVSVSF